MGRDFPLRPPVAAAQDSMVGGSFKSARLPPRACQWQPSGRIAPAPWHTSFVPTPTHTPPAASPHGSVRVGGRMTAWCKRGADQTWNGAEMGGKTRKVGLGLRQPANGQDMACEGPEGERRAGEGPGDKRRAGGSDGPEIMIGGPPCTGRAVAAAATLRCVQHRAAAQGRRTHRPPHRTVPNGPPRNQRALPPPLPPPPPPPAAAGRCRPPQSAPLVRVAAPGASAARWFPGLGDPFGVRPPGPARVDVAARGAQAAAADSASPPAASGRCRVC